MVAVVYDDLQNNQYAHETLRVAVHNGIWGMEDAWRPRKGARRVVLLFSRPVSGTYIYFLQHVTD